MIPAFAILNIQFYGIYYIILIMKYMFTKRLQFETIDINIVVCLFFYISNELLLNIDLKDILMSEAKYWVGTKAHNVF